MCLHPNPEAHIGLDWQALELGCAMSWVWKVTLSNNEGSLVCWVLGPTVKSKKEGEDTPPYSSLWSSDKANDWDGVPTNMSLQESRAIPSCSTIASWFGTSLVLVLNSTTGTWRKPVASTFLRPYSFSSSSSICYSNSFLILFFLFLIVFLHLSSSLLCLLPFPSPFLFLVLHLFCLGWLQHVLLFLLSRSMNRAIFILLYLLFLPLPLHLWPQKLFLVLPSYSFPLISFFLFLYIFLTSFDWLTLGVPTVSFEFSIFPFPVPATPHPLLKS